MRKLIATALLGATLALGACAGDEIYEGAARGVYGDEAVDAAQTATVASVSVEVGGETVEVEDENAALALVDAAMEIARLRDENARLLREKATAQVERNQANHAWGECLANKE